MSKQKPSKSVNTIAHILVWGFITIIILSMLYSFWMSAYIIGYGECSKYVNEMVLERNINK